MVGKTCTLPRSTNIQKMRQVGAKEFTVTAAGRVMDSVKEIDGDF